MGGAAAAALRGAQPRRPNLLFILTDGWRADVLPSAGDPNLVAPHLAQFAREGAYCSNAYTSYPVCCPSRAAILSGNFPHAAGVTRNHSLLPLDQPTMSSILKRAGYRTGYIGKWHLDGDESPGFVPPDRRRGFDYWAASNVQHQHYKTVYFADSPTPIDIPGFQADFQTNLAIDFIRRSSRRPFYLYLSLLPPHGPYTPPPRYATYDPAALRLRGNVPKAVESQTRKDLAGYYGLCSAVDDNIGRVLSELHDRGLADDTIVVFTSDHGGMLGSQGLDEIDRPYEEASKVPLLMRYPRRIRAGLTIRAPISNVDYAPTLLGLCGIHPTREMQGTNLAGLLTSGRGTTPESIYAEGGMGQPHEWRMVVTDKYKLVVDASLRPTHLFHLVPDPLEQDNLVSKPQHRQTCETLRARLQRWAVRTGDPIHR